MRFSIARFNHTYYTLTYVCASAPTNLGQPDRASAAEGPVRSRMASCQMNPSHDVETNGLHGETIIQPELKHVCLNMWIAQA